MAEIRSARMSLAAMGRRRLKLLQPFGLIALFCGGCVHLPEVGGMPLPDLSTQAPATYRSLTDIPEPPPVTPPNTGEAAIRVLSQQRGSTEDAAGGLRGEPFTSPLPAPPQVSF